MPSRRAAWSVPTEQVLRDLAAFDAGDARVLSVYLDVDGRRYPRPQDYEHAASVLLGTLDPSALPRVARFSLEADMRRVREFVTKEFERGPIRGLAIFACAAARLWDVYRLPTPVRSRVVADRHPHVLRLEALLARAERLGTAIVGRERARLFTTRLGETVEKADIRDEVPGQHDQGGWSQANYSRHIEELATRHYRNVSEALFALSQREPLDSVVLAGPDEVVATFEKVLHPRLAERIAARIHLPAGAPRDRVRQATLEVWDRIESERAAEAVTQIMEDYAAGRGAVVGITTTLEALQQSRVEILALSDAAELPRSGRRCTGCHLITLEAEEKCPACGAGCEPVADLAEEMVDEALRRRCRVVTAETRPLPEGVGALLRY